MKVKGMFMYINDADDVYGNVGIGDNTLVFSNTEVCGSVRGGDVWQC